MAKFRARAWRAAVLSTGFALAGCMPNGPVSGTMARLPTWYRYLSGDDVRQACAAGASDRVRFVYNAVWREQVRAYEVAFTDYGARIDQYAWGPASILAFSPEGPLVAAETASVGIDAARTARLERAMDASDVAGPAPTGTFLRSDNFYWIVAACRNGQFHYNAFQQGDGRFEALSFPRELFDADRTGVAVNMPRGLDLRPVALIKPGDDKPFVVQVGANGLNVARWN
ncbi:hypothetical protein L2U69_13280 [Zavarzinia compransoris]|uniref:hypothetical protein n=1 Tax=Zavarzinia marina TaxID=2911065 RepID=UPI001F49038D|nr:hypothetical protein [Zavarzinia marina]MCF4166620.1 hypothetical protein [Zavarzinia marina]